MSSHDGVSPVMIFIRPSTYIWVLEWLLLMPSGANSKAATRNLLVQTIIFYTFYISEKR